MPAVLVIAPVERAWNGMKHILFKPFDIGKWFALGFSAWLATLGETTGSSFNIPGEIGEGEGADSVSRAFDQYSGLILGLGLAILLLIIAIGLVAAWASARGKFMFIDNLVHNRALVAKPWNEHATQGNSLFLWNIGLGCTAVLLIGIVCAPMILKVVSLHGKEPAFAAMMGLTLITILLFIVVMIGIAIASFVANEFVVPVMKKRGVKFLAAWAIAKPALGAAVGPVVLYTLFRIVLSLAMTTAMMMFGFLTCCCGFLLLAIPYINAVVLLPVLTLLRLYNLEFVRQLGPDFDLLTQEPPPPPTPEAPPLPAA